MLNPKNRHKAARVLEDFSSSYFHSGEQTAGSGDSGGGSGGIATLAVEAEGCKERNTMKRSGFEEN